MKAKLIVFDGVDSSGKETQTDFLIKRLKEDGLNVLKLSFPIYSSDSSALVKMYLNGDFGNKPSDVSSYVSSTFYTVDRFASFKTDWENFYNTSGVIICDRYTTSNMVHQASKIEDIKEKDKFLDWLYDFEYIKFGLPVPDCVFFLDMPPEYGAKLMKNRKNKINNEDKKDIHESNIDYLIDSYKNAKYVANKFDWKTVNCIKDSKVRLPLDISNEIYDYVIKILK